MTFQTLANQAQKFVGDNSPAILTGIGIAGTITTAVLTGKAVLKADRILMEYRYDQVHTNPLFIDKKDAAKKIWQCYIPPVASGIVTIGAVLMANQIGTRRAAAMASAYVLSEKAFAEYKDKVAEKIGETKARNIRTDIAQDRVNRDPVTEREIIMTGAGSVLCYEPFTGRYFHSDMETLKSAQNAVNHQINNSYYASLSDFYDRVGLDHTTLSDDLGWNSDELMELTFDSVLASDGRPCLSFEYEVVPIKGYHRLH